MSKRKWHDLQADPSDLPTKAGLYLVTVARNDKTECLGMDWSFLSQGWWLDMRPYHGGVIAWREMPKAYRPPAKAEPAKRVFEYECAITGCFRSQSIVIESDEETRWAPIEVWRGWFRWLLGQDVLAAIELTRADHPVALHVTTELRELEASETRED